MVEAMNQFDREAHLPPQKPSVDELWNKENWTPEFAEWAIDDLRREAGNPEQPLGVYVIDGLDPRSSLGRMVEEERFSEEFDNGPEYLKALYGEFEEAGKTKLIVVVDHEKKRPAGVIRTVINSEEHGCRILNDLQHEGENGWGLSMEEILEKSDFAAKRPEEIMDIPTIAISKDYSAAKEADGASKALCAGLFQYSLAQPEIKTWVCSLARVPYILIQEYTDNVMEEFDGVDGQPYYGDDDTVPLWSNFREYETRLKETNPTLYARYAESVGLENYSFSLEG